MNDHPRDRLSHRTYTPRALPPDEQGRPRVALDVANPQGRYLRSLSVVFDSPDAEALGRWLIDSAYAAREQAGLAPDEDAPPHLRLVREDNP